MKTQHGFTLVELVIVIGIIGIIASIALPTYQNYLSKALVVAALSEITPEKIHLDAILNEYVTITGSTLTLQSTSKNCSVINIISPLNNELGTAKIECTMLGGSSVNGFFIAWFRSANGSWRCSTDVGSEFQGLCV